MNCVIDGRQLEGKTAGVQRFIKETLLELDKIAKPGEFEVLIPPNSEIKLVFNNLEIKKYGFINGLLWEQVCLPWYMFTRKKSGIFLCTIVPLLYPKGISVVHDIMMKTVPELKKSIKNPAARILLNLNYRIAVKHATVLATVSEYSKKDIARTYGKKENEIYVMGNGWQHILKVHSDSSWKIRFPQLKDDEFFFALSANRKQKNFKWIYEVAKKNPQYMFCIAGGKDEWQNQEEYMLQNLLFLGYISDEEIRSLLENCKAFLFPSFAEGFGIPPMEALAVGAKAIVAHASCLPEIYGKSVYYIDPFDYEINLDELLSKDVAPAEEVLDRFGWDKTARQLYNLTKML